MQPMKVDFDPLAAEVIADPHRWVDTLRDDGAVHWLPQYEAWLVIGYDEVTSVLRNPNVFSSKLGYRELAAGRINRTGQTAHDALGMDTESMRMLISTDPPDHTRVRRLLSKAFTPRSISELTPRLQQLCDELIGSMAVKAADGEADFMEDFAIPFPVTVIAELMGIPVERRADFRRWSDAMAGGLSGELDIDAMAPAAMELMGFLGEVVADRQKNPGPDLISRLVAATADDEPDPLTIEDVMMISLLLLLAGNETTTNLLGNTLNALVTHPDQADAVYADPALVPLVLEEVLRWDSPVQQMLRGASEPAVVGGVDIEAGAPVVVSFAAANRDPKRFPDPGRFDIERRSTDHFAFGNGIHFCLGASLARLEGRLAFETLIRHGVRPTSTEGAVRTTGYFLRGFSHIPFTLG